MRTLTPLPTCSTMTERAPSATSAEISSAAADAANSLVLDQVAGGVAVRMSVLYHLLGSDEGAM